MPWYITNDAHWSINFILYYLASKNNNCIKNAMARVEISKNKEIFKIAAYNFGIYGLTCFYKNDEH